MKIGILSDTHDQADRASLAVATLIEAGAEVLVHCGDITGPAVVARCVGLPIYYVFGNNDFDEAGLRAAMARAGATCLERGGLIEVEGRRIAVTHGDSDREARRLLGLDPEFFLYGHSHLPADDRRAGVRWINPGALHRAARWTVAVLDLADDSLGFLTIEGRGRAGGGGRGGSRP